VEHAGQSDTRRENMGMIEDAISKGQRLPYLEDEPEKCLQSMARDLEIQNMLLISIAQSMEKIAESLAALHDRGGVARLTS
jgi:hypothetical protein